jgi:gluconolactonase
MAVFLLYSPMKRTSTFPPERWIVVRALWLPVLLLALGCGAEGTRVLDPPLPYGSVERNDPRIDALIPPGTRLELLAEGFDWSEGPVWFPDGDSGYLLFSDVPRNTVYAWEEGGDVTEYLCPSGYQGEKPRKGELGSNGLLRDSENRLVLCEHGDRRIGRIEDDFDETHITLADSYEGKRLNSPNDGVFHSRGDLYFTDPPYGLPGLNSDPAKELDFNGVYLLRKEGELVLLTKEMSFPNGVALSPDEKILYVANSDPQRALWMAYPLKEDGTLAPGKVFFDCTSWVKSKPGLPDGLKVDRQGNLFATGPGGVCVFSPDGTHLGTIDTGVPTANCAWGDDGSTLYITADMYLCRIRLTTRGAGF